MYRIHFTLAFLLSWASVFGQDGLKYSAPAFPEDWSKPGVMPDHIILTFEEDPSTTQSVTWRTDSSVKAAYAEIALADAAPNLWHNARQYKAITTTMNASDIQMAHVIANYHSITFRELLPDTTFAYRVGDGRHWSEWFHFRTAAQTNKPFSFIYIGDAQNYIFELWSRLLRGAYKKAPDARFVIHAGDLINHAHSEQQWHEWFTAGGFLHAMLPSAPTPGNHEYRQYYAQNDESNTRKLSVQWKHQYTLPQNGIDSLKETNYYFDYQNVRVVSLNSNEYQNEQALWLDEVLAEAGNKWKVITFHHPIFSGAGDRDNKRLRELWKPVFDKHQVDLVLTGHDHTYTRGQSTFTGPSVRNNTDGLNVHDNGTVYVVSVSGGKMYNLSDSLWSGYDAKIERAAENTQLFQLINVEENKISYEAFTATGQLYDAFELIKNPTTRRNEFIEKVNPGMPERRFSNTLPYVGK